MRLAGNALSAQLTFSRKDMESLAALDTDGDGRISDDELARARPRLASLAAASFEVRQDEKLVRPVSSSAVIDQSDAVHFRLDFKPDSLDRLILRSTLLARLPRGHKQYLSLRGANGEVLGERMLDAGADSFEVDADVARAAAPHTFRRFFVLGVEHILTGYDHLAFLLALLLAGGSFRSVTKIVTSFTAAHSITLALAALNIVSLPPSVAEPMIAASIVYVGLENIFRRETRRRWLLTFGFGLVHGFGFATALRELGLGASGGGVAVPLVSFNLGVEAGQLSVVAVVLPLIWKLRATPSFVLRYVPACSLLIALAGGYWLVQRTLLH
ncbi:MAG: hypothetical protein QOE33_245 [Acidobacteriota bacterium]|nr:hypothetical protein [Acidobacteriota bacterium]